jgi:carbonic anhydrase
MKKLPELFENNRQWAERMRDQDPNFFKELSEDQNPDYLWIGCADSRVPANQIIDQSPGDVFVHRNIANVVIHSDLNCQSVLQYAVEVLKVKHIIVCGHYGCGGVTAAFENQELGLIDNWLRHIKDIYSQHLEEIKKIGSRDKKIDRLCEINVRAQATNVAHSPFVQKAWKEGQELSVHGWIYNLENGHLNDLDLCISSADETSSIYQV